MASQRSSLSKNSCRQSSIREPTNTFPTVGRRTNAEGGRRSTVLDYLCQYLRQIVHLEVDGTVIRIFNRDRYLRWKEGGGFISTGLVEGCLIESTNPDLSRIEVDRPQSSSAVGSRTQLCCRPKSGPRRNDHSTDINSLCFSARTHSWFTISFSW